MVDVTAAHLDGSILAEGQVTSRILRTDNAFDIGSVQVDDGDVPKLKLMLPYK